MDERINRFKLCDFNFHAYLSDVFKRLPEPVRDEVLDDTSFQILTDDDALKTCVLRYRFSEPVQTLVYLNTNLLRESRLQIIYMIASEVAHYIMNKKGTALSTDKIDTLLRDWGFDSEVAAARSGSRFCESRGYKIAFEWAKKQDPEYLQQHFGIYYEVWNDQRIDTLPDETPPKDANGAEPGHILKDIIPLKQGELPDSCRAKLSEMPSLKQEMLAGIVAAMRESFSTPGAGGMKASS